MLEFPALESHIWLPFKDQGVEVIGIDPGGLYGGDTQQILTKFKAQSGITFPIGWDAAGSYFSLSQSGLSPFPQDIIVAPDGTLAYLSAEFDPGTLVAIVEALLEEQ